MQQSASRMSNIYGLSCRPLYKQLFKLWQFDHADASKTILTFVVVLSFLVTRWWGMQCVSPMTPFSLTSSMIPVFNCSLKMLSYCFKSSGLRFRWVRVLHKPFLHRMKWLWITGWFYLNGNSASYLPFKFLFIEFR